MISDKARETMLKGQAKNRACKKKIASRTKGRGGLTLKQAKLVANKAKGMSHVEAYKDAYDVTTTNKNVMYANAQNTLSKPHVKEALNNALEKAGVSVDFIVAEAVGVYRDAEKSNDRLSSLKFLSELARLTGATATVDPNSPKTVNILNVQLDKLKEHELMDLLLKSKKE